MKVCESLKKIAKPYFREMDMDPINGEPLCAEYLTLKDGVVIPDREEDDDRNSGVKDYKPGKTADAGTKRKMKEYERAYNIQRTDRSSIFFFAVETSGGLGKEAREFVKLLAKMSGGDLSSTIRIYQTLAAEFQTARAEQIYFTNRRYVTNNPPLLPSSLFHPLSPVAKE
jgi:hypothetical protein